MDEHSKESILRAGITAPSADNSQPWRFAWCGDELDLRIDASRSGSVSDSRHVLSDLAAGACLENMIIRAHSLGYAAEPQIFPTPDDALWVARVRWRGDLGQGDSEPLAVAIEARCTDRSFPWRGAIAEDVRARLAAQVERISPAQLYWLEPGAPRAAALAAMRQAEALRFKSPALHAELFSSVRFDVGWCGVSEEGLAPATLAVEPPLRPVFQMLRRRRVMVVFNRLGAAPMMGLRSADLPARLAPGLCLLAVPSTTRADIVATGRAMQRLWLQATLDGLSVQPFAAAGVLALGFVAIESACQPSLARLQASLRQVCPNGHPVLFLRLGYARSRPQYRSGRRELASFGDFA